MIDPLVSNDRAINSVIDLTTLKTENCRPHYTKNRFS